MNGFERQRLLNAFMLLVTALFVSSGLPQLARWRRQLRLAAIIGFLIVLAVAFGEIAVWLVGGGP